MNKWRVPLADIAVDEEEVEAVAAVIRSRWLTMGPRTEEFETAFARRHGVGHAVAVSSCTAALHLSYVALGIGSGDEVIMPAMTFVATANAAVACGARPVFADIISVEEPTIDPEHVDSLITARTKAIAVVHYAGYPCRMEQVARVAARHGLPVVEDCAHSPGVRYQDGYLGGAGAAGCFSFFSNKNMTTGEGGMVITQDGEIASRIRLLRSHGMTSGTWGRHNERPQDYDVREAGWNYRIDEIRSALGLVQLGKLDRANAARASLTARYRRLLGGAAASGVAFQGYSGDSAHHLLPYVAANPSSRERLVAALTGAGVQSSHHYPPAHLFELYRKRFGYRPGMLCNTESFASREITLPLYSDMKVGDVDYVAKVVVDALQDAAGRPDRMGRAS